MNNSVMIIAGQELRATRANRLAILLLGIFMGMVLLSGFIGWATHHTVTQVYDEALREGTTTAPNFFANEQPLELIRNTVIYVVLIGALLAILIGVQSSLGDRKAGVIDLLFSRPVTSRQYVAGKLLGMQCLTGLILMAAGTISWGTIWLIRGQVLSLPDSLSLLEFFMLAWLFLLPFTVPGFIFGAVGQRETSALLIPILVWIFLTFMMPQLGTAEHPVAMLNPVPAQPASQGPFFTFNRSVLQPFSITDRFKSLSAGLLHLGGADSSPVFDGLTLALIGALSCLAAIILVGRQTLRRELYE